MKWSDEIATKHVLIFCALLWTTLLVDAKPTMNGIAEDDSEATSSPTELGVLNATEVSTNKTDTEGMVQEPATGGATADATGGATAVSTDTTSSEDTTETDEMSEEREDGMFSINSFGFVPDEEHQGDDFFHITSILDDVLTDFLGRNDEDESTLPPPEVTDGTVSPVTDEDDLISVTGSTEEPDSSASDSADDEDDTTPGKIGLGQIQPRMKPPRRVTFTRPSKQTNDNSAIAEPGNLNVSSSNETIAVPFRKPLVNGGYTDQPLVNGGYTDQPLVNGGYTDQPIMRPIEDEYPDWPEWPWESSGFDGDFGSGFPIPGLHTVPGADKQPVFAPMQAPSNGFPLLGNGPIKDQPPMGVAFNAPPMDPEPRLQIGREHLRSLPRPELYADSSPSSEPYADSSPPEDRLQIGREHLRSAPRPELYADSSPSSEIYADASPTSELDADSNPTSDPTIPPLPIMTTDDYWIQYFRNENFTEYYEEDENRILVDPDRKPPVFNEPNLSPFQFGHNEDTNTDSTDVYPPGSTEEAWLDWSAPPKLNANLYRGSASCNHMTIWMTQLFVLLAVMIFLH